MTDKEQRVWAFILDNRQATVDEIAEACGVEPSFAQSLLNRIGTPEEIWRGADNGAGEWGGTPPVHPAKPTRETMLNAAKALTCGDRNKSYGPPHDNLSDCAALWEAYLNTKAACLVSDGNSYAVRITSEDVAWMMALVKMTRSFQPGFHYDNYVDAAAYSAIAGECREILQEGK